MTEKECKRKIRQGSQSSFKRTLLTAANVCTQTTEVCFNGSFQWYGLVPEFATKVFIVADPEVAHRPVLHVRQCNHLEGHRQRLVGPICRYESNTADFILNVPGVYTHSMETINLSLVRTCS